jgi:hypothetical protein
MAETKSSLTFIHKYHDPNKVWTGLVPYTQSLMCMGTGFTRKQHDSDTKPANIPESKSMTTFRIV